jgi:hypothetical protein
LSLANNNDNNLQGPVGHFLYYVRIVLLVWVRHLRGNNLHGPQSQINLWVQDPGPSSKPS